jgi:hypothetical protein
MQFVKFAELPAKASFLFDKCVFHKLEVPSTVNAFGPTKPKFNAFDLFNKEGWMFEDEDVVELIG